MPSGLFRGIILVCFCVFVFSSTFNTVTSIKLHIQSHKVSGDKTMASNFQSKIEQKLYILLQQDPTQVKADIMVQLQSPDAILARECGSNLSRDEKTTCMVNNLETFAEQTQQQVKDLLAERPSAYKGEAQYFWINNSVNIKKATGKLILELAALPNVCEIRTEEIFHITNGSVN